MASKAVQIIHAAIGNNPALFIAILTRDPIARGDEAALTNTADPPAGLGPKALEYAQALADIRKTDNPDAAYNEFCDLCEDNGWAGRRISTERTTRIRDDEPEDDRDIEIERLRSRIADLERER